MSQREDILNHIRTHGSITPLQALVLYKSMRCGARIAEIRQTLVPEEHQIITEYPEKGKRYAIYRFETDEEREKRLHG